jgi:hypothetical protein
MTQAKMRMAGILAVVVLVIGVLFYVGWAGIGSDTAEVSGCVTFEGKPVGFGTITMIAEKGSGLGTASIKDGTYAMPRAPVGPVRISITGSKIPFEQRPRAETKGEYMKRRGELADKAAARGEPVPDDPPDPNDLPGKYSNDQVSGLTFEVRPGKNTYSPDLKP